MIVLAFSAGRNRQARWRLPHSPPIHHHGSPGSEEPTAQTLGSALHQCSRLSPFLRMVALREAETVEARRAGLDLPERREV